MLRLLGAGLAALAVLVALLLHEGIWQLNGGVTQSGGHSPPTRDQKARETAVGQSGNDKAPATHPPLPLKKADWMEWQLDGADPGSWGTNEVEGYLKKVAPKLTDSGLARVLRSLLPGPEGYDKPGALGLGSISLADQRMLCEKYIAPAERESVYQSIWHRYKSPGNIESFRSEILDLLPPSEMRHSLYGMYFKEKTSDFAGVVKFLQSDEFRGLKESELAQNRWSPFSAAQATVTAAMMNALEEGVSATDLIEIASNSNLDDQTKRDIVSWMRKRGPELEVMRNNR